MRVFEASKKKGVLQYVYEGALDTHLVTNWIADSKKGRLSSISRSEPLPTLEETESSVKKVVAKNFEQIVLNPEHDVLIKFYAPWCKHCKKVKKVNCLNIYFD
jgi:thiol-disulfide isomerase/thioredoxin